MLNYWLAWFFNHREQLISSSLAAQSGEAVPISVYNMLHLQATYGLVNNSGSYNVTNLSKPWFAILYRSTNQFKLSST